MFFTSIKWLCFRIYLLLAGHFVLCLLKPVADTAIHPSRLIFCSPWESGCSAGEYIFWNFLWAGVALWQSSPWCGQLPSHLQEPFPWPHFSFPLHLEIEKLWPKLETVCWGWQSCHVCMFFRMTSWGRAPPLTKSGLYFRKKSTSILLFFFFNVLF